VVMSGNWGLAVGKPECGRYLRQSQPAHSHGSFAGKECRPRRSTSACPKQFSGLALCIWGPAYLTRRGGPPMFDFQDLFQWDRFITPTIIKTFYWLVIGLIVLFGLSGIFSALGAMAISPFGGFILLLSSIAGVVVGVVFSRIAAEFILIVFRINEHLGAIRDQGGMR
jgi:Domain of unknown function (DUF4282)